MRNPSGSFNRWARSRAHWLACGLTTAVVTSAFVSSLSGNVQTPATTATPCPDCALPIAAADAGFLSRFFGFFDNYGRYMPRIHCLQAADGRPDWPWIIALVALSLGVIVGYLKIFHFWRRSYLAEAPRDRNRKLMDLAYIFLFCAICGYAMSIMMFWWPAYRLLAVFLAVLVIFTWKFAHNLDDLTISLSAVRVRRELEEALADRTVELERQVAERTRELESTRAAAIAADEAKSHFLANMSHEIRTPMTAILGFTELLDNPKLDAAMRQRHLRTVRESGRHLLNVVNDILDLAKIEAGKLAIESLPCDFHDLLGDVRALMQPRASDKGLLLILNVDPKLPHRVDTDATRVRQILLNLVGNAVKFTERGSITVTARRDDAHAGRPTAIIEVIDTGVGMSADQLERLFNRFNQAESSTARRFGGSGLGLVISRHLVHLLGGVLDVASRAGEGSRFTLTLPLKGEVTAESLFGAPPSREAPPLDSDAPSAPAIEPLTEGVPLTFDGATVLVVDDGPENRRLIQFMLEREGLAIDLAEDGQEAVDRVAAHPDRYDAILMDIHMPRLDGYAATALLRTRGFAAPIIALTASTMAGDRERCLAAGCDQHVSKPIDADHLLSTLHRAIQASAVKA